MSPNAEIVMIFSCTAIHSTTGLAKSLADANPRGQSV
jgi:hypothetical protein